MARKTNLAVKLWKRAKKANRLKTARVLMRFAPKRFILPAAFLRFKPSHHLQALALDREFFNSITPESRILEIGASSGTLTNYLLQRARVRPENYTIMDHMYALKIPLKRKVATLVKQGKVRQIAENYHSHNFGTEQWNHILMPASLFPNLQAGSLDYDEDISNLFKKMLRHLKIGGTLRASHLGADSLIKSSGYGYRPQLHKFLEDERKKGNIDYRLTEASFHADPKVRHNGIIITKLRESREE